MIGEMALTSSVQAEVHGPTTTTVARTTTTVKVDVTTTTLIEAVTTTTKVSTTTTTHKILTTITPRVITKLPRQKVCKIGDIGPGGGRVFYVSTKKINVWKGISSGGRCLEAAPKTWVGTSWDPNLLWGCAFTLIGTGSGIGSGASNTAKIMAGCATPGIAAKRAGNLTFGGKSDWFLPSLAELGLIYTNLKSTGIGVFVNSYYWSSSEASGSSAGLDARRQNFVTGSQWYVWSKDETWFVRPIRAFG